MKAVWACVGLLAVILLISSVVFEQHVLFRIRLIRIDVPQVDGRNRQVKEDWIRLSPTEEMREACLACEFYLDSIKGYENGFATADGKTGVRLELWQPSAVGIAVGDAHSGEVSGFCLSPGLALHQWNRLEVRIPPSGLIAATLNGVTAYGKRLRPQWGQLHVGSDSAGKVPFHGLIRNFHAEVAASTPRPYAADLLYPARFLLAVLVIFCCYRAAGGAHGLSKEAKVKALCAITLIGFTTSVFFHYVAGGYCGLDYPWTTFLVWPKEGFKDFLDVYWLAADLNPYVPGPCGGYAPFSFIMMYPLTFLSPYQAVIVFLFVATAFIVLFNWYAFRGCDSWLRFHGAFVLTFLAYPVLMVLDRGNTDGFLFIVMALFILAYQRGHYRSSVVLLALASAMKVFPAVFLLLFVADRKYKETLATCVLTVLITAICACCLEGGFANTCSLWPAKLATAGRLYEYSDNLCFFSSTLYGLIRMVFTNWQEGGEAGLLYGHYQYACIGILTLLSLYVVWVERSFRRRVSLLTLALLLLPATNYDYRLIFLYIPLALLLSERSCRFDSVYIALYGLLLIPKAYLFLRGWISVSVILNPILLLGLVWVNLHERCVDADGRLSSCPPDAVPDVLRGGCFGQSGQKEDGGVVLAPQKAG